MTGDIRKLLDYLDSQMVELQKEARELSEDIERIQARRRPVVRPDTRGVVLEFPS